MICLKIRFICIKTEVVLLLGGKDKGYDYSPHFTALKGGKVVCAVLYGENRYHILEASRREGFEPVTVCAKFADAVMIARTVAKRGQTVLLSPASASFDEFAGYEERGERFVEAVARFEKEARCIEEAGVQ